MDNAIILDAEQAERRTLLLDLCASLPEVTVSGDPHLALQVRKKTFAYYQVNHHGDGMVSLVCKALAGEQSALIALEPQLFFKPSYLGTKGWVGLRLDLPALDWTYVTRLLITAYQLTAPKQLIALMAGKK